MIRDYTFSNVSSKQACQCRGCLHRWQMVFPNLQGMKTLLSSPQPALLNLHGRANLPETDCTPNISISLSNEAVSTFYCVFQAAVNEQVKLSRGVRAHWLLLKQRLKKICNMDGAVLPLWSARPAAEDFGPPFLLSVSSFDQQGFLHGTLLMDQILQPQCL